MLGDPLEILCIVLAELCYPFTAIVDVHLSKHALISSDCSICLPLFELTYLLTGACLRTNSKYAGGGHGGYPLPYVRKKIKI